MKEPVNVKGKTSIAKRYMQQVLIHTADLVYTKELT